MHMTQNAFFLIGSRQTSTWLIALFIIIFVSSYICCYRSQYIRTRLNAYASIVVVDRWLWRLLLTIAFGSLLLIAAMLLGFYASAWIRFCHLSLITVFASRLCWRIKPLSTFLENNLARILLSLGIAASLWFCRASASSFLSNHFGVDAGAIPLALNAGTAIIFFLNWTAILSYSLLLLIAVAVGAGLAQPRDLAVVMQQRVFPVPGRLGYIAHMSFPQFFLRAKALINHFERINKKAYCFSIFAFVSVLNIDSIKSSHVQYLVADQVVRFETVDSSWCSNVNEQDRILFLGPPYDNALVVRTVPKEHLPPAIAIDLTEDTFQLPQVVGHAVCNRRPYLVEPQGPKRHPKPAAPWPQPPNEI